MLQKMTKILAIGNSFSQDSTAYLHDIAACGNVETMVVNLYIGGCSLQRHDENIRSDAAAYQYEINGKATDRVVSIKEVLQEDDWDIVVTQQASHDSGLEETYFPYLENLFSYVKKYAPKAKQMLHETWAYEIDSTHPEFERYGKDQLQMYKALKSAYKNAAEKQNLPLIPCGDVVQQLRTLKEFDYPNGGKSLCRDGFHLHFIYGRYIAAAVWYQTIFKKSIAENSFLPQKINDETYDESLINLIKREIADFSTNNK